MFACDYNNNIKIDKCKLKDMYNTSCKKYNATILEQRKKSKKLWNLLYNKLYNFIESEIGKEYLYNLLNKYNRVIYLEGIINISNDFKNNNAKYITNNLLEQFKNNCNIGLNEFKRKIIIQLNTEIFDLKSKLLIAENSKLTIYNLKKIEILKKKINNIKSKFLYKILKNTSSEIMSNKERVKNDLYCEYLYMSSIIEKQETLYNDLKEF